MLTAEDFEGNTITSQERIPAVQALAAVPAQSQDYGDFLVKYVQNIHGPIDVISDVSFQIINEILLYGFKTIRICSFVGRKRQWQ